jgi:hypothetical protein
MLRRKSRLPGDSPKVLEDLVTVLQISRESWSVLCWDDAADQAYVAELAPHPPEEATRRYEAVSRHLAGVKQVQLWVGDDGSFGCDVQLDYPGHPVLRWHEATASLVRREGPAWTPEAEAQADEDQTLERLAAWLRPEELALESQARS